MNPLALIPCAVVLAFWIRSYLRAWHKETSLCAARSTANRNARGTATTLSVFRCDTNISRIDRSMAATNS